MNGGDRVLEWEWKGEVAGVVEGGGEVGGVQ